MDLETVEHDADTSMSRRSLVALTGAAGFGGLAAALFVDRAALALPSDDRPNLPTESDLELLEQVIGLELAGSELYRVKLEALGPEPEPEETEGEEAAPMTLHTAVRVMAENHQAYAQAVSGDTGLSADEADTAIVAANTAGFAGSDAEFFAAAHAFEQAAAATHNELIGQYDSDDAITLTASIALTEVRHATVLADLLGVDDLDVLFSNTESALSLGDDA